MPNISIIIPHKQTVHNDVALKMAIASILEHTQYYSWELLIDTETPKDPYKIWNEMSAAARGEILVFSNSDVIFGPDWDVLCYPAYQGNCIVTGYLVEPGNIGVASQNIHLDFGKHPNSFRKAEFDAYVNERLPHTMDDFKEERGWYMPCAMRRDWFLSTGGFDTTLGFPNPNDILFWEHCIKDLGTKLFRTKSYAYHFQNLSSVK